MTSAFYRPTNWLEPTDWVTIFGRSAPVEIDIGTGKGAFILAAAAASPDRNFLGVEILDVINHGGLPYTHLRGRE